MDWFTFIHSFSAVIYLLFPRANPIPHPENMGKSDVIDQLSVIGESDDGHTMCSLL